MGEPGFAYVPDARVSVRRAPHLARCGRARRLLIVAIRMWGDGASVMLGTAAATSLASLAGLHVALSNLYVWTALAIMFALFFDVYRVSCVGPVDRLRRRVYAFGLLAVVAIATAIVERQERVAVAVVIVASVAIALPLSHYADVVAGQVLARFGLWGARIAILGRDGAGRDLARALNSTPELGIHPLGVMEFDANSVPENDAFSPDALRGMLQRVDFLVLSGGYASVPYRARTTIAPPASEIANLPLQARYDAFGSAINMELFDSSNLRLKRSLDLMIAVPVCLAIAPVVAVLAVAVKIADPGPAFYVQRRLGKGGATIGVFKLRTMHVDADARLREHLDSDPRAAEEWRRHFKLADDPRVIPGVGKLLRRFSLDELPQIANVLAGDLSLVGPRPFPAYHLEAFDEAFRELRASVPPGVTGLWQVTSRSDGDLETQKVLDIRYVRNWSIWLDLYILLQTIPAVLTAKGAR